MSAKRGNITVEWTGRDLAITGGRIRVSLTLRDGGYCQEYYALDRRGEFQPILSGLHKNLIPWSEHRTPASPMISGDRPHLFGVSRDSLRMVYSQLEVICHEHHTASVRLTGAVQGHNLSSTITLDDSQDLVHVLVEDELEPQPGDPLVEYLMSSYVFLPGLKILPLGGEMDYVWSPALRPGPEHVVGDLAFHSPAVMVQQARLAAAIVPDLDLLRANRRMPAALDLDLSNGLLPAPLLSYGFCGYEPTPGADYYRHDVTMACRLRDRRLTYGLHILLDADSNRRAVQSRVARFLWSQHGQTHRPSEHVSAGTQPAPERRIQPDARAAFGLYAIGHSSGSDQAIKTARGIKDEILSAPQDRGLFPTRFSAQRDEWDGCSFGAAGAYYHTVECSQQLYWLLKWYQMVERDKSILRYARSYAEFLTNARLKTGEVPSWYTTDQHPLYPLRSGTQTAASALFLAEMGRATGYAKYTSAAERSARFVLKELAAGAAYQDYTLMDRTTGLKLECRDPHSRAYPQSAQAMLWVARLCLDLHSTGSSSEYLAQGVDALDALCMLQCVSDLPWRQAARYGLCAQSNVGARFDPELTAEFGRCALDYGVAVADKTYCERGAAALAAAAESEVDAARHLRIAASLSLAHASHGTGFVHVGKKWAVPMNGWRIEKMDVERGVISLDIRGHATDSDRLVFGGLRANSYKVSINGATQTLTRKELEEGISITSRGRQLQMTADEHD